MNRSISLTSTNKVKAFVDCLKDAPSESLINNLATGIELLEIDEFSYPITINNGNQPGNCYICNPVTGYTAYAIDETRHFVTNAFLNGCLKGFIRTISPVVGATGIDRVVHLNNWLFSTNPCPAFDRTTLKKLCKKLVRQYPSHAIVVRSLNTFSDKASLDAFSAEGFHLLPSRQVYIFDGRLETRLSKDMKNDRALLRKTPFKEVANEDFSDADYQRCAELYAQLYIDKYTPLNPQYSADFIRRLHKSGVIQLQGLRCVDANLVAIGGRFEYANTLTQPILGYDTFRPQKEGLYRLITYMAQRDALRHRLVFNMSAGAADFKRKRLAIPALEYSAVYTRHLKYHQNLATKITKSILAKMAVPIIKRYKL